jgi:tRNA pseudouridine38-40 synthase
LFRNYLWHVNLPLNVANMKRGIEHLIGIHDFSAFQGSGCTAKSPIRHLTSAAVKKRGEVVEIWLEADAFLQYMVRNIAGTLVEVGLERFSPDDVKRMLLSRDRTQAGRTAPPHGLYLVQVSYPG